jgi:hypothetical protein
VGGVVCGLELGLGVRRLMNECGRTKSWSLESPQRHGEWKVLLSSLVDFGLCVLMP